MVMGIHQAAVPEAVPGQVILLYRIGRDGPDKCLGIHAKIAHIHIQVFHIEQDAAAGAPAQLAQKFALAHFRVSER